MREQEVDDLFLEPAEAICLTTNGSIKANGAAVMGRGTAAQARRLWYGIDLLLGRLLKKRGNVVQLLTKETPSGVKYLRLPRANGKTLLFPVPWHIVAFPVKDQWPEKADLDLIRTSAKALRVLVKEKGWSRVLLPRPGCGNGGLSWSKVRPALDRFFVKNKQVVAVTTTSEEKDSE